MKQSGNQNYIERIASASDLAGRRLINSCESLLQLPAQTAVARAVEFQQLDCKPAEKALTDFNTVFKDRLSWMTAAPVVSFMEQLNKPRLLPEIIGDQRATLQRWIRTAECTLVSFDRIWMEGLVFAVSEHFLCKCNCVLVFVLGWSRTALHPGSKRHSRL
jgi:hypothetical protein